MDVTTFVDILDIPSIITCALPPTLTETRINCLEASPTRSGSCPRYPPLRIQETSRNLSRTVRMPEPLTITVACRVTGQWRFHPHQNLTSFVNSVQGAQKDVKGFSQELNALELAVHRLKHNETNVPEVVKDDVVQILKQCKAVTADMQRVLDKHQSGSVGRSLQWTIADGDEVSRLRQRLEPHKSGLLIALAAASIHQAHAIKQDTNALRGAASIQNAELILLRREVAELRQALTRAPNTMLERYLAQATDYAESVGNPLDASDSSWNSRPDSTDEIALTMSLTHNDAVDPTNGDGNHLSESIENVSPTHNSRTPPGETAMQRWQPATEPAPQLSESEVSPVLIHYYRTSSDRMRVLLRYLDDPYLTAARPGFSAVDVSWLLQQKVDVKIQYKSKAVHDYGVHGGTPLHIVVKRHHDPAVIPLLHAAGTDLESRSQYGHTPLRVALYDNNRAAVRTLVRAGASLQGFDAASIRSLSDAALLRSLGDHENPTPYLNYLSDFDGQQFWKEISRRCGVDTEAVQKWPRVLCSKKHRAILRYPCGTTHCPIWRETVKARYPTLSEESYADLLRCIAVDTKAESSLEGLTHPRR